MSDQTKPPGHKHLLNARHDQGLKIGMVRVLDELASLILALPANRKFFSLKLENIKTNVFLKVSLSIVKQVEGIERVGRKGSTCTFT
jgi:hypothetical protein